MKTFLWMVCLLWGAVSAQAGESQRFQEYGGLLHDFVHAGEKNGVHVNLVDYRAWKADARWQYALQKLADADVSGLGSKEERLAFWINAYNMMAIKKVLDAWPVQSIRDEGSFFRSVWKQDVGVVAGKVRTLNEIEHHILRPMGEPLMHVAIVCASVSCPDLRAEPYDAADLYTQLHEQAVLFLNNQGKGFHVDADGVHVSKIFDWFADDFSDVPAWIHRYHTAFPASSSIEDYLSYDWQVNAQ